MAKVRFTARFEKITIDFINQIKDDNNFSTMTAAAEYIIQQYSTGANTIASQVKPKINRESKDRSDKLFG